MTFLIRIFITISIVLSCFNSIAQRTEIISGTILNQRDSMPIANTHIININANKGVVSNAKGNFSIQAQNQDTLQISIIGFETKIVIFSEELNTIYLKGKNYEIETFTVLPYKDFREFKEAFINLKIKDEGPKINPSILAFKKEKYSRFNTLEGGGISYSGGISGLLGHFNKHVQDKANYLKLLQQDKYKEILAKKFSPDLVKRATKLADKETITLFMEYCDFTDYFIESSSEYELAKQIIECHQEFNSLTFLNK